MGHKTNSKNTQEYLTLPSALKLKIDLLSQNCHKKLDFSKLFSVLPPMI